MIISDDWYCSNGCRENKARSLGFVNNIHLIMCPKCGEKYGVDVKDFKIDGVPFNVWFTKAKYASGASTLN